MFTLLLTNELKSLMRNVLMNFTSVVIMMGIVASKRPQILPYFVTRLISDGSKPSRSTSSRFPNTGYGVGAFTLICLKYERCLMYDRIHCDTRIKPTAEPRISVVLFGLLRRFSSMNVNRLFKCSILRFKFLLHKKAYILTQKTLKLLFFNNM